MKHKEVYGYLRVSTKGQAKENKHGFKRQGEVIESFAKGAGFKIIKYFQEPVSGCKNGEDRPAFMEMVSTILRENRVSCIVIEGMEIVRVIAETPVYGESNPRPGAVIPPLWRNVGTPKEDVFVQSITIENLSMNDTETQSFSDMTADEGSPLWIIAVIGVLAVVGYFVYTKKKKKL